MYEYSCNLCDKSFKYEVNLKRHKRTTHGKFRVFCDMCSASTTTKSALIRHINTRHRSPLQTVKFTIQCPLCPERKSKTADILQHYVVEHDIVISSEDTEFPNENEFQIWKKGIEKEQVCEFVCKNQYKRKESEEKRVIYRCHRDGCFKSRSKAVRHCKILGTNKINGHCPAKMDVIHSTSGRVKVSFSKTHVGHHGELGRLRLSRTERDDIAAKVALKIPFDDILDSVRISVCNDEVQRAELLTRKDLHNIARDYNLKAEAVRHGNDCTSVESWISEMQEAGDVVQFYKPQSVILESHPQLKSDDFVLIIMNEAQKEILKKFGTNCVCMDGTHDLNPYGFELTTLLVLDNLCEGFPCALMFSSRVDFQVMEIFVTVIQEALGESVRSKVFMSDMAPTYYNAWVKVMPPPDFHLFCTWHVDRAWRKNLSKIKGQEKQTATYKILRTLMEERDEPAFVRMFNEALKELKEDPDTELFGLYVENEYKSCVYSWAYCYRLHSGLNTNMHIERMHGIIKHMYLKGKKPKRLDIAIHTIMRFVRDKLFERLISFYKGKVTSKLSLIRHRHNNSLSLSLDTVICEAGTWKVPSQNTNEIYEVTCLERNCNCDLKCTECQTCIHSFCCTCPDSSIKFNMCKHIHLVIKVNSIQTEFRPSGEEARRGTADNVLNDLVIVEHRALEEHDVIMKELQHKTEKQQAKEERKAQILRKFLNILDQAETSEDFDVIDKHLNPILPTIQSRKMKSTLLLPVPAAKTTVQTNKFQPQRKLFSIKKKAQKKLPSTITRPSTSEQQNIALNLLLKQSHD